MTLPVAIVGCGIAGRARARAVHAHPDLTLRCVHRGRFAAELGAPEVGADEVLRDVEVVIVASPSPTHAAWVRSALDAGRHVIVEYPLARTADEAQALLDLAAARGRVLHVEHIERLSATTTWMAGQLSAGWTEATLEMTLSGAAPADVSTLAWLHVSRLHRLVVAHGWPQTAEVTSATPSRLEARFGWTGGRWVQLVVAQGEELPRALRWRVRTPAGVREVRDRAAYAEGERVELPTTTLFADDLAVAVRRIQGRGDAYVDDAELIAVLRLAESLGCGAASAFPVKPP